MTVSPCLRQNHCLGNVSHLPSPALEWCCWKQQLSSRCLTLLWCFPQNWRPLRGCFVNVLSISALCHFPGPGLATELLGNLCLAVQEAERLVIKVFLHAFEHVLQSAPCFYFSQAGAFHLHSYYAKKCLLLQEVVFRISAMATAIVGTCFRCGK